MKGIDISNWQASLNAGKVEADFVIVKATEGIGYVNPSCDTHYQQAKKAGKKLGVYHFARNSSNDAIAEADFFLKHVQGYIKEAILVLDWEDAVGDVAWAERFIRRVIEKAGIVPMIYMSESVVLSHNWASVAKLNVGLWIAKYRDMASDYNYNMDLAGEAPAVKHWGSYAMWQWTSSGRLDGYAGDLDLNVFYGDASAWDKYAGGKPTDVPAPEVPQPQIVVPTGADVYVVKAGDTLSAIASKFGTSWQHLQAINGISNPNLIYAGQKLRVNQGQESRVYVVQAGDTLSGIASRFGTDWQTLQRLNGIANANLIWVGQTIRLP